jgi:hypothetical protein
MLRRGVTHATPPVGLVATAVRWIYLHVPLMYVRKRAVDKHIAKLDQAEVEIIRIRHAAEAAYAADPRAVPGRFSVPKVAAGSWGSISLDAVRKQIMPRLQEHGIVTPDGSDASSFYYRWTKQGKAVRTRLLDIRSDEINS